MAVQTINKSPGNKAPIRVYSSDQCYALSELARLAEKRAMYEQAFDKEPSLVKTLHKALYSASLDCRDLGMEKEARNLLERANFSVVDGVKPGQHLSNEALLGVGGQV